MYKVIEQSVDLHEELSVHISPLNSILPECFIIAQNIHTRIYIYICMYVYNFDSEEFLEFKTYKLNI